MAYLLLTIWLMILGIGYVRLSEYRLIIAVAIGLSYIIWGIIKHWREKMLCWPIILEYFTISLLATMVLIFISLRT